MCGVRALEIGGSASYLSETIQIEMIECLWIKLGKPSDRTNSIVTFFRIVMDTTQDISKVDQLSIVGKYAVVTRSENGQPVDIEVKEAFLSFYAAFKHNVTESTRRLHC
ncbi:zinc finger MYM-type protein 1-like [Trichonephila clavata]|uniref:Zinc finger MYM-type protein 1-like n=1 Tax=Trichonephila clavata TaxID=2740835 RepID=A0A8X6FW14_TRICU|nr:zinc finger MYM-type protein 1-like [Trichonephila clavata]